MSYSVNEKFKRISKVTANELRNILFDEIKSLRAGKSSKERATAVYKLSNQILESLRLEVQNKWTSILVQERKYQLTQPVDSVEETL